MIGKYPSPVGVKGRILRNITLDYKLYGDRDQVYIILQNNTNTQFGSTSFCQIKEPHCLFVCLFVISTISKRINTLPSIICKSLFCKVFFFFKLWNHCYRLRSFSQGFYWFIYLQSLTIAWQIASVTEHRERIIGHCFKIYWWPLTVVIL